MWTLPLHHWGVLLLWGWTALVSSCPASPKRHVVPAKNTVPPIHVVERVTPKPATVAPPPDDSTIEVSLTRGEAATLICDDRLKKPPSSLRWYKNQAPLNRSALGERVSGGSSQAPDLVFQYVTNADAAIYRCHIQVNSQQQLGPHTRLTVKECNFGFYGDRCDAKCGQCKDRKPCATFTGFCEKGCEPNWAAPYCQQLTNCTYKRYGRICDYECGQCARNRTCNYSTGHCDNGCEKGWIAPLCQVEEGGIISLEAQRVALTVGIGAPATLGLIAAVLQIVQCASNGLPFFPTCGKCDSSDDLPKLNPLYSILSAAHSLPLSVLRVSSHRKQQPTDSHESESVNFSSGSEDVHSGGQ